IAEMISTEYGCGSTCVEFFKRTERRWNRIFLRFDYRTIQIDSVLAQLHPETHLELARRLYFSCTDSQRAVLYQISSAGWVNPNNLPPLSDLIARGWVSLAPLPVLTMGDDSLHIIPELTTSEEIQRWDAAPSGSTWTTLLTVAGV